MKPYTITLRLMTHEQLMKALYCAVSDDVTTVCLNWKEVEHTILTEKTFLEDIL